ncbi:MAG: enoyl-CoA hydratase/isomerase family protein [Actinomycetota bacterium]|nr:enoyl-CoA hydratase/isomerase family protein [Actinomycetota bacterium]
MFSVEISGRTAYLVIDRPEKLNALPGGAWPALRKALLGLEENAEVKAVVLSGAGNCFSVGGDIGDMKGLGDLGSRRSYLRDAVKALRDLEEFPKPVIAAIHGACLGGGLELALVCDMAVADETATFGVPESRVGLIPGVLLVRGAPVLNSRWLKYLAMTGDTIGPDEALRAGLINFVVPAGEHLDRAGELAGRLADRSPIALALIKEVANRGVAGNYSDAVEWGAMLQGSEDFAEGSAAFKARRSPEFRGR